MRQVKVSRLELLKKLKDNRDSHRKEYKRARQVYEKAVIKELEDWLENAKLKGHFPRKHNSKIVRPDNHEVEYNEAIAMAEMSVDEYLTLDQMEFRQFVLDQWAWKDSLMTSMNSSHSYLSRQRAEQYLQDEGIE